MNIDQFQERAAIMEFCGGMDRFRAETEAAREQGYQRWEFRNAISKRHTAAAGRQRPASERDATHHLPGMQPPQAQEAGSLSGGHVR